MTPIYFDKHGKENQTSWDRIFESTQRVKAYIIALGNRFVEREKVMEKLLYAFLLREHLLIWGNHGSAKTEIADAAIDGIKGAKTWSKDLSRFTTDTMVFGDYDIKAAQETGELVHITKGSLVEANFANLGELLDANEPLLRSLMRLLNRRQFIRGSQREQVPLMTVIGNTNFDPSEAGKKNLALQAVLDRFIFKARVEWVADQGKRLAMLRGFLSRNSDAPLPELNLNDVIVASGAILAMNLLEDKRVQEAYEELGRKYGEVRGRPLSDRMWLKAAQSLEASALLRGHKTCDLSDLAAAGIVFIEEEADEEHFKATLETIKSKWESEDLQIKIDQELEAIAAQQNDLPTKENVANANDAEIVRMRRGLKKTITTLEGIAFSSQGVAEKRQAALVEAKNLLELVNKRIDEDPQAKPKIKKKGA